MWTDAFCFFVVPIILVCEGSYSRKHVHMDADTLCFIQDSVICTAWSVNQNIHVEHLLY